MIKRPLFAALAGLLICTCAHARSASRGAQTAPALRSAPQGAVVAPAAVPSAQLSGLRLMISPAGVFNPDELPPVRIGAPDVAAERGPEPSAQGPAAQAPNEPARRPEAASAALAAAAAQPVLRSDAALASDQARPGAFGALTVLTAASGSESADAAKPAGTARLVFDGGIDKDEPASAPGVSGRAGTSGRLSRWTARAAAAAAIVAAPTVALAQGTASAAANAAPAMLVDPQFSYLAALYLIPAGVLALMNLSGRGAPKSAFVGTGAGLAVGAVATLGFPAFAVPIVMVASVAGFLAGGGAGLARAFGASPRVATMVGLFAALVLGAKAFAFGLPAVAVGALAAVFVTRYTALEKADYGGLGIIITPLRGMLLGLTIPIWFGMWAGPQIAASLRRIGSRRQIR